MDVKVRLSAAARDSRLSAADGPRALEPHRESEGSIAMCTGYFLQL